MFCLSNLKTEELRNVARLRNVDVYENMSTQQPEHIFTTPSASISAPTLVSTPRPRPKPYLQTEFPPISRPITRSTPVPVPIAMDECENTETVKTRPIAENTWFQ